MARKLPKIISAILELVPISELLDPIYLGLEAGKEQPDAFHAVGFSFPLPEIIHCDVVRQDERTHAELGEIFGRRDLFRLRRRGLRGHRADQAASRAVQDGASASVSVLALDAFSPRLTPALARHPAQQLDQLQGQGSCAVARYYVPFARTLAPLTPICIPRRALVIGGGIAGIQAAQDEPKKGGSGDE